MTNYISPAARRGSEATINEPTHRRASHFDQRGIALQTVIIIVVLLAIAGSVAAVLLNRAGDVTSELEGQDVTLTVIDTAAECQARKLNTHGGDWDPTTDSCTWTGDNPNPVTETQCDLAKGQYMSGSNGKCVVAN